MTAPDVIVIGGGIAGLSTAWHLARGRMARVCLVEIEKLLGSHASGRNGGIFRVLDTPRRTGRRADRCGSEGAALALRSRELLASLSPEKPLLERTGLLFLGARSELRPLADLGRRLGIAGRSVDAGDLERLVPALRGGDATSGLLVDDDGVLDVYGVIEALARAARAQGVEVRLGTGVAALLERNGRITGVRLDDGDTLGAAAVVVAAGAWAGDLGATCGAPLPLESRRRHLALLEHAEPIAAATPESARPKRSGSNTTPVVWRLRPEVYFRPESGGVLASPCDAQPWPPSTPPCSAAALVHLARVLARTSPVLAAGRVRRTWACLRTLAPDGDFVAGEDPRRRGLFWIAGLGGRGMTCGIALGELVARLVVGSSHPGAQQFSAGRLVS